MPDLQLLCPVFPVRTASRLVSFFPKLDVDFRLSFDVYPIVVFAITERLNLASLGFELEVFIGGRKSR